MSPTVNTDLDNLFKIRQRRGADWASRCEEISPRAPWRLLVEKYNPDCFLAAVPLQIAH